MRYHNVTTDDMMNGDGLRVVLWLAGCEHHCKGCQNPITWDRHGGLKVDESVENEIFTELDKDYITGITFSGGDPLATYNRKGVTKLIKKIREKYGDTKTIWVYTGYKFEDVKDESLIDYIDVLVDGKFEIENKNTELEWVGSSNQRVIDMKKTIESGEIVIYKSK